MWKLLSVAVVVVALLAALLREPAPSGTKDNEEADVAHTAIRALQSITKNAQVHYSRLAIGYNTNVDLIVDALGVLKALRVDPTSSKPHPHSSLKSLQEFHDTFANFFAQGSAAERLIENDSLCADIVAAAQRVDHHEFYIGGNAALMAKRFALAAPSARVLLAGWLPENLRAMLPQNVEFVPNAQEQPISEAHLIMEYQKNVDWGEHTSPRANRFIAHCDATNAELKPMPEFHTALEAFKPEAVVLAGLHLLERGSEEFQNKALATVADYVASSNALKSAIVHLELASVASTDFLEKIGSRVVPFVDSLGLNEQELGHVFFALNPSLSEGATGEARAIKAADYIQREFRDPSVAKTVEALTKIFTFATSQSKKVARSISRIHFHSLKFHIIVQKKDAPFEDPTIALAAGSLIATGQACNFTEFDLPYAAENEQLPGGSKFDPTSPINKFEDKAHALSFYVVPVGVCRKPGKTVGLGDAISASGLLHHAKI